MTSASVPPPPPPFGGTTYASPLGPSPSDPPRLLRRSPDDKVIVGVAGGLGRYFAVDPVLFRVVFGVLAVFGGVGVLLYLLLWLLIPEDGTASGSFLERVAGEIGRRKIPAWVVIAGVVVVVWLAWFSWWVPGPTAPALILVGVIAGIMVYRRQRLLRSAPPVPPSGGYPPSAAGSYPPPAAGVWTPPADRPRAADEPTRVDLTKAGTERATDTGVSAAVVDPAAGEKTRLPGVDAVLWTPPAAPDDGGWTGPLVAPLDDPGRSMQSWLDGARAEQAQRRARRRPVRIAVVVLLLLGVAACAVADAVDGIPFPAYAWVVLGVSGAGLLVGLVLRRTPYEVVLPLLASAVLLIAMGNTRVSLRDGAGQNTWRPTNAAALSDHRVFAGRTILDLTSLATPTAEETVTLDQAAGRVEIVVPSGLNVAVDGSVNFGQIQLDGSRAAGRMSAGAHVHLVVEPNPAATGPRLTVRVRLADGYLHVVRPG